MVRTVEGGVPGCFILQKPIHDLSVNARHTHAMQLFMRKDAVTVGFTEKSSLAASSFQV